MLDRCIRLCGVCAPCAPVRRVTRHSKINTIIRVLNTRGIYTACFIRAFSKSQKIAATSSSTYLARECEKRGSVES